MKRRSFLSTCAAATAGLTLWNQRPVFGAPPEDKPFAKAKLRMSAPIDWFDGETAEQRLETMAAWGFTAYEWLGPKGDLASLRAKADSLGMELSCIVGAGAIAPGQMVLPKDHDKVVKQFEERVEMAKQLNCRHLVGLSGNERKDASREEQTENVIACVKRLAPIAEKNNVILVMEALNPLVDHKGYFMCRTDHTMEIINAVGSPNVKMLFDIYHQQITEGNVIRNFTANIDRIGHFHVADNPGRKEPGSGELNYANIFKAIAATGYQDFVALECGHSKDNYEDTLKATLACLDAM
jgi:hydroxypyruvate isomerase